MLDAVAPRVVDIHAAERADEQFVVGTDGEAGHEIV